MADPSRTEKPTGKRRQEARSKGQVVRSREFTGALGLLAVVMVAGFQSEIRVDPWRRLLGQMLDGGQRENQQIVQIVVPILGALMLHWLMGPLALLWSVAVGSSIAQGGIVFSVEALAAET